MEFSETYLQSMKNQILKIKSTFNNPETFEKALTHRSWLNENKKATESNERLEFLGDAVLEYVVSSALFKNFPQKEEGFLTALRANIVNTKNLSKLATRLNLGEHLLMSKGEKAGGGAQNPNLLANTVEAIIGAVYIDQGLEAASNFINKNLLHDLDKKLKEPLKDPKSMLQEKVQAQDMPTPEYKVVTESGPDHDKNFVIEVIVGNRLRARGEGSSKSRAQQAAASAALLALKEESR